MAMLLILLVDNILASKTGQIRWLFSDRTLLGPVQNIIVIQRSIRGMSET